MEEEVMSRGWYREHGELGVESLYYIDEAKESIKALV
jgi:hypothetical protein